MNKKVPTPANKKKYPLWMRVNVPLTNAEMKAHTGRRCRTYLMGCAICDSWKMFDETGTVDVLLERRAEVLGLGEGV
jgi:hypothetical protein